MMNGVNKSLETTCDITLLLLITDLKRIWKQIIYLENYLNVVLTLLNVGQLY